MKFQTEQFLRQFVLPLVGGGRLHVGRPLDASDVERLVAQTCDLDRQREEIEQIRQRVARRLWPVAVDVSLGPESLRLAAGVHNLLFFNHPEFDANGSKRAIECLSSYTRRCLSASLPADEGVLIARHTLLFRLGGLRRTDVDVRFWLGKRSYIGQQPPARLLRWRSVRRVRLERREVAWLDLVKDSRQQALVRTLYGSSPLTELLAIPRPLPPIQWERLTPYLGRRRIARLVCHEYLRLGLDQVGPAIADGFWRLVDRLRLDRKFAQMGAGKTAARALHLVVGLVEYLYAGLGLTERLRVSSGPKWRGTLASVLVAGRRCAVGAVPGELFGPRNAVAPRDRLVLGVRSATATLVAAAEEKMGKRAVEQLANELRQALAEREQLV